MANLTILKIAMNASLAFDARAVLSWILQAAIKSSGEPQIKIDEVSSSLALSPIRVRECLEELEQFGFLRLPTDDLKTLSSIVVSNVCIELEPGQYVLSEQVIAPSLAVGREELGYDAFKLGAEMYQAEVAPMRNGDGSQSGWFELRITRNPQEFVKVAKFVELHLRDAADLVGTYEDLFDLDKFMTEFDCDDLNATAMLQRLQDLGVVEKVDGLYRTSVYGENLATLMDSVDLREIAGELVVLTKEFDSNASAWSYFDEFRALHDIQFWAKKVVAGLVPNEDETLFVNVDDETYDLLAPDRDEVTVVRIDGAIFRVKEGAEDAKRWPGLPSLGQTEEREAS